MRLINTFTHETKVFASEVPPYTIISHRWAADNEATLGSFQAEMQRLGPPAVHKPLPTQERKSDSIKKYTSGVRKVVRLCQFARDQYDAKWLWIDTVCIDKTNNVELSEAINSMYRWYQDSARCIVYLEDIMHHGKPRSPKESYDLAKSNWFTRGWTLQELIAPRSTVFLDTEGTSIGTKQSLADQLSEITHIPHRLLLDPGTLYQFNAAQRLSWASMRDTTRGEDQSYSLLGLLDINLPLLYGEGRAKAFQRLQATVLEQNEDDSLFAWAIDPFGEHDEDFLVEIQILGNRRTYRGQITGLFADSPRQFLHTAHIERDDRYLPEAPRRMTNRGLELSSAYIRVAPVKITKVKYYGEELPFENNPIRAVQLACSWPPTWAYRGTLGYFMLLVKENASKTSHTNRWRRLMIRTKGSNVVEVALSATSVQMATDRPSLFVHTRWPEQRVLRGDLIGRLRSHPPCIKSRHTITSYGKFFPDGRPVQLHATAGPPRAIAPSSSASELRDPFANPDGSLNGLIAEHLKSHPSEIYELSAGPDGFVNQLTAEHLSAQASEVYELSAEPAEICADRFSRPEPPSLFGPFDPAQQPGSCLQKVHELSTEPAEFFPGSEISVAVRSKLAADFWLERIRHASPSVDPMSAPSRLFERRGGVENGPEPDLVAQDSPLQRFDVKPLAPFATIAICVLQIVRFQNIVLERFRPNTGISLEF